MMKVQVISAKRKTFESANRQTGEMQEQTMLVADLVFTDGQTSFSFEHTWFQRTDRNGIVTEALPNLEPGVSYEFIPQFGRSEYGKDKGKLRATFLVRPVGVKDVSKAA